MQFSAISDRDAVTREINLIGVPVTVFDVLTSGEFCVFAVNRSAELYSGLSGKDVAGHLIDYIVPADTASSLSDALRRCAAEKTTIEREDVLVINAERHDVRFACVPVVDAESRVTNIVVTFCRLSRAEPSLRDDGDLPEAAEYERRSIATDLHEGALQNLALVNLNLSRLRIAIDDADALPLLDETIVMVDETMRETRALVDELSPFVLSDLGLAAAVRWLAERLQNETGTTCSVRDDDLPKDLLPQIEMTLFQSMRELLRNVRKHAEARRVRIVCKADASHVLIRVEDDGVGFSTGRLLERVGPFQRSYGLRNLRDRIERVGGNVQVDTAPGLGTRVVLTVPAKRKTEQGPGGPVR